MDIFHDRVPLPSAVNHRISNKPNNIQNSGGLTSLANLLRTTASATLPSYLTGSTTNATETLERDAAALKASAEQGDAAQWRRQVLGINMRQATCYEDWLAAASELDHLQGRDEWKKQEESHEYDCALVRARLEQLEAARIECDAGRMLFLIRTSLTRDLGGMGDLRLYKHCNVGTKALIERYIEVALDTLDSLLDLSSPAKSSGLDTKDVYEQLLSARQAFGRSALLLSGGGTLGMNHIGVVKGLFDAQLLPRIISGASAGSIVAAVLCTKTDDEIPRVVHEFCYGDLAVFEREGEGEHLLQKAFRLLTKGALFDISNLIRVMRGLLGDMTFQEAYNRTRRILNICVSTASLYELPRLLNYVTAPNVMIWSAVATSCSVPLVYSPAQLLAKDPRTGLEVPWDQSPQRWIDGSVDNDLPMTRLAEMFNVNHFIVSQVNPHVVPFLEKDEDAAVPDDADSQTALTVAPSWLRTVANLAKDEALHRMHVLSELGIMPTAMSKLRSVLSQRYSGDITILPEISLSQFPRVLKNPDTDFMVRAMLGGERATWPKLSQVRNHCAIELALDDAIHKLRTRLVFSPSQTNLRLNAFQRSKSLNLSGPGKRRRTRRASHDTPKTAAAASLSSTPIALRSRSRTSRDGMFVSTHSLSGLKAPLADIESGSSGLDSTLPDELYDSDDMLSDSSMESPPSPRPSAWPYTRQLLALVSQPNTPFLPSKSILVPSPPPSPVVVLTTPKPFPKHVADAEMRYKKMFHKTPEYPSIHTQMMEEDVDATVRRPPELDVSGTRGMVRRKRTLSTGMKGLMPPERQ